MIVSGNLGPPGPETAGRPKYHSGADRGPPGPAGGVGRERREPASASLRAAMLEPRKDLRNLAIIAHVDHGKTTLMDGLLRQTGAVGDHQHLAERARLFSGAGRTEVDVVRELRMIERRHGAHIEEAEAETLGLFQEPVSMTLESTLRWDIELHG